MKVDREVAARIAALASLEMPVEALDRMAVDLTAILGYVEQLAEVDAAGTADAARAEATLRPDEPGPTLDRALVEANAPRWRDGFFVVPRVVGGE